MCVHVYVRFFAIYRIAGNFRVVQNFAVFAYRLISVKIKTAKIAASAIFIVPLPPRARTGTTKIKTLKISSGALRGDSMKFCPAKISHYTEHEYLTLKFFLYLGITTCSYECLCTMYMYIHIYMYMYILR